MKNNLNPKYTFDNFIIRDSNQIAFLAAVTVSQEPIMKYSPMFFYGKAGSGKTHLLQAIARRFKKIHKKPCLYATAENFTKDLISATQNNQKELFKQKYRNNSLLIIDDIQFLAGKAMMQQELLIILKEFQIKDRQIILAANRYPKRISGLDEDLIDSCYGGLMLEIEAPKANIVSSRVRQPEILNTYR